MQTDRMHVVIRIYSNQFQFSHSEIEAVQSEYHSALHITAAPEPVQERHGTSQSQGGFQELSIYIFFYASLAFLVAKLLEGALKEAGGDLYRWLREFATPVSAEADQVHVVDFLADILARNEAKSYKLYQDILLGCTLHEQHVVIRLDLCLTELRDPRVLKCKKQFGSDREAFLRQQAANSQTARFLKTEEQIRSEYAANLKPICVEWIQSELASLNEDWPKILSDIDRFGIGREFIGQSPSGFHVIERGPGGHWSIKALQSWPTHESRGTPDR
jgi:hypothetical protein